MKCRLCNSNTILSAKDVDRERFNFLPIDICTYCIKDGLKPVKGIRYCEYCHKITSNRYTKCYECRHPEFSKVKFSKCECGKIVCNKTECNPFCAKHTPVSFCKVCDACIKVERHRFVYCSTACENKIRRYLEKERIRQRTVKGIDLRQLLDIYKNKKDNHVDHIIPLNHPLVSGLNVPWNLQYLPPEQNVFKSNRFDGTYNNDSWREEWKEYVINAEKRTNIDS